MCGVVAFLDVEVTEEGLEIGQVKRGNEWCQMLEVSPQGSTHNADFVQKFSDDRSVVSREMMSAGDGMNKLAE